MKTKKEKNDDNAVELLFAGDILLDDYLKKIIDNTGGNSIFSNIRSKIYDSEFFVVNLEGLENVRSQRLSTSSKKIATPFLEGIPQLFQRNRINLINLGNNHTIMCKSDDIKCIGDVLSSAGINMFGDPVSLKDYRCDLNGIKLSFISYNQFGEDIDDAIAQISIAKEDGYMPIVYAHWGKIDKKVQPELHQIAHSFIDNGAVLVIGSHPHVAGEEEIYSGKPIFYSLGNLLSTKIPVNSDRHGLLVKVNMGREGVLFWEKIPIELNSKGRVSIYEGPEREPASFV